MNLLGTASLSKGLTKTIKINIRDEGAIPDDFASIEFRAGLQQPDGTFFALQVTKGADSIVVSSGASAVAGVVDKATLIILYRRTAASPAQALGYLRCTVEDWGYAWS